MAQINGHPDPDTITGLEAYLGHGAAEAKGFWADAWSQVLRRPAAIIAITWIGVVAFFAVAAPLLASGHPLIMWTLDKAGKPIDRTYPLFAHLSGVDWLLLVGSVLSLIVLIPPWRSGRSQRLGLVMSSSFQAGLIVVVGQLVAVYFGARDAPDWARALQQGDPPWMSKSAFVPTMSTLIALGISALFLIVPTTASMLRRAGLVALVGAIAGTIVALTWSLPPVNFDYAQRARDGEIRAIWTLVPWSPAQRQDDRDAKLLPPGATVDQALARRAVTGLPITGTLTNNDIDRALTQIDTLPLAQSQRRAVRSTATDWLNRSPNPTRRGLRSALQESLASSGHVYVLGSDSFGQDVLSQLLHACRLAVSIGFVSTGIAVIIGVTLGALMGYFGGLVDLLLYRIVEIFMAVPLLFILIVAAGVLPRNTYVTMAIIGCFTWTGAARFTRAEFLKLRNQDFVQAARGVGLPLRSILFRHMLPNGVTPVLVDASFAVAFAIILEATLSFLGLGPADQASWGRLLADATNEVGDFLWWLAIFPGLAIFLAALSYNLLGESLRDAIDPKLKKARV